MAVTGAAYSAEDAHELKLTVDRAFAPDETVTVSYTRPADASGLWDVTGNQLEDIEDRPVENNAPPAAPAAPALAQASDTSVTVSWVEPEGAAVTGYGVRYRRRGAAQWTSHAHTGTATSATIPGLAAGHSYEAQVRASGAGGDGPWSESGRGHTGPARFVSADTPENGRGLDLTFTKDIFRTAAFSTFSVVVDGVSSSPLVAIWEDNTVGLLLQEALRRGQTVTVAYAKPATAAVSAQLDAQGNPVNSFPAVLVDAAGNPVASRTAMLIDADGLLVDSFGPEAVVNASTEAPEAARFESAATEPQGRGLVLTFTGDILVAGRHTDYTVLVDGQLRSTQAAFWEDDTVGLVLDEAVRWGETVTVAYEQPSDAVMLRGANDVPIDGFGPAAVDNTVPEPPERFDSAATEPQGRGLVLTFTGDILVAGRHTDYTVLVDGQRRSTQAAFWEDDTVGLVLDEPVRWGETVTVAYEQPSDAVMLRGANDAPIDSFGPAAVDNTVPEPANAPATGAPAITGTARVGGTLTASADGISDADGMTAATLAWQWVSSAGGTDIDIAGATASTYAPVDDDVGRTLKVRVSFTDDRGHAETLTSTATEAVAPRPNRPATGAPTITGTAQVGETLTASADGIADADGMTGATLAWQWVSSSGGTDTDIAGATASTYAPVDDDVGRTLKVRVSFTDDRGHAESLTSAPTAAVLPRPLTASLHAVPAEHDGTSLFTFELRFSDDFAGRFDYKVLRDQAFQVVNGRVREARRQPPGQNRSWEIAVRPALVRGRDGNAAGRLGHHRVRPHPGEQRLGHGHRSGAVVGGRRPRQRGRGPRDGLRGHPQPRRNGRGDRGLRHPRRHRGGRRGLHPHPRHPDLRAGRDGEDRVGAHPRRRRRRGRGDLQAEAAQRPRRLDPRRRGHRHHRERRPHGPRLDGALRAHRGGARRRRRAGPP